MAKQPLSHQLDTPAQPCCLCEAGGTALDRSAPTPVPLPRCCAQPHAEFSPSLPSSRQQPPRSSSQALRQPVSTCLCLSLSSITSLSRAGSVSASHASQIFGFQGLCWVFSLPCDWSAGEGFVRAGLGETGSLWVYNVLLKHSF